MTVEQVKECRHMKGRPYKKLIWYGWFSRMQWLRAVMKAFGTCNVLFKERDVNEIVLMELLLILSFLIIVVRLDDDIACFVS